MSKLEVFKVQRPLGGEMTDCLVYNKDQSITFFLPFNEEVKKVFEKEGNPPKLYIIGSLEGKDFDARSVIKPQKAYTW